MQQCCAHFIHEITGHIAKKYLWFIPRVGDELRFDENVYYTVVLVIWVYDEPDHPYPRVNIGIADLNKDEQ